jgi:hypothetical protein
MHTQAPGNAVRRELATVAAAVQQEEQEEQGQAPNELARLLEEKAGLFRLRVKTCLGLFHLLRQVDERCRLAVFRGELDGDPELDKGLRDLYSAWLDLSARMKERLDFFARHKAPLDAELSCDLDLYAREAAQVLSSWRPPTEAKSPALRARRVTREEAVGLGLMK